MSKTLLLRRNEALQILAAGGLRVTEARLAIATIPQAKQRLCQQARWWRVEVEQFDCVAFLRTLSHDGDGRPGDGLARGRSSKGGA